ncbi:MAG: Clp protease N-terminal domain-containing protein, partial [Gaiellaceae bacterium]
EEEGLAARVLESLDITVEEVRAQVARIVGQGDEVTTGQIPFTPRAKKVLELALREALSLGHNYIGTEHILLGLVRENEGVAARILLDFDADAEKIRNAVVGLLSGQPSLARPVAGMSAQGAAAARAKPDVAAKLARVREEMAAIAQQDFARVAFLRDEERRLRADLVGTEPAEFPFPPGTSASMLIGGFDRPSPRTRSWPASLWLRPGFRLASWSAG